MINHIIVRYGEISLKGNNRGDFENVLVRNIQRVLKPWSSIKVQRTGGRIMVVLGDAPAEPVMSELQRVFGVLSVSPALSCELDLDKIADSAIELMRTYSVPTSSAKTFKVEAKRANKRFPLTSPQIAEELGARLLAAMQDWRVDVHSPDLTVFVEIRDEGAFVYGIKLPGLGGMPVGTGGKVGLLLSGGIDSPVAGWLCMKRGVELEAIHFHSYPFTSERALQKVETLCQILANWGGRVRMHTVHFTDVQSAIRKYCPEPLTITIMRRMMMRIATKIAAERKLLALATGESLGQVASQTLESMNTINEVTSIPVLRPLVSEDKIDIIRRARHIGTYETSILPYEDCCTVFVPKSPRTRPTRDEAAQAELELPVQELVRDALARTTIKTFLAE